DLDLEQKYSGRMSGGVAVRFVNSNLTGGISVQDANSKAGPTAEADVSAYYVADEMVVGERDATLSLRINLSHIGSKTCYTETATKDFIPINLRLGPSFKIDLDEYNSIAIAFDANKLLVPTPPVYLLDQNNAVVIDPVTGRPAVASGVDPNVGVAAGMFGSF